MGLLFGAFPIFYADDVAALITTRNTKDTELTVSIVMRLIFE